MFQRIQVPSIVAIIAAILIIWGVGNWLWAGATLGSVREEARVAVCERQLLQLALRTQEKIRNLPLEERKQVQDEAEELIREINRDCRR